MTRFNIFLAILLSLQLGNAFAHGDEVHGEVKPLASPVQSQPATEAHSPDFALYAQLQGDTLIVYLDRYSDNQPIANASIEVEGEAFKGTLQAVAAGIYQVPAQSLNHPGEHSLVFTVIAGEQSDLLEASLNVDAASGAGTHAEQTPWWWLLAALLVLVSVAVLLLKWRLAGSSKDGISQ